jgi:polyphosphate kinase
VVTIKQTLYRTSPDSPFIESLMRAAEAGKQVACLVELRARFDEEKNVRFARQLEKAGVHVAYGVLGLKTHCKTSLVVRKERQRAAVLRAPWHGQLSPQDGAAVHRRGAPDVRPGITSDLVDLFNFLTGLSHAARRYKALLVAPFTMRKRASRR